MRDQIFVIPLLLTLLGCQGPSSTGLTALDEKTIREENDIYVNSYRTGNWTPLEKLLTDDVVWMVPNAPALVGKQAVVESHSRSAALADFWVTPLEIRGGGNVAFVRGTYKVGSGEGADEGKYIEIRFRQSDGSWPIARSIWNSNAPARQ
jgi:ketosteroid isomerase-like protein